MGDALKKVQAGQRLEIPAVAYNAFIDAVRVQRAAQHNVLQNTQVDFRQADIVKVRNQSGLAQDRFAVLGIDGPLISPSDNLAEFKNQVGFNAVVPNSSHVGRFVVLLDPLAVSSIGRAWCCGVFPVRVLVVEDSHKYADLEIGNTSRLQTGPAGCAQILWRETGTGTRWAVVRLGNTSGPAGDGNVFPVTLSQVGGADGTRTTMASWTYNVKKLGAAVDLLSAINPTSAPHKYKRESLGKRTTANFGLCALDESGDPFLTWINETIGVSACDIIDPPNPDPEPDPP